MDYEVFLVRLPGYTRPTRHISRLLRVSEHGLSLSSLSPSTPSVTEYSFESVTNVAVSQTDAQEFSFDVLDSAGASITHSFLCFSRERLLTTLFNRLDDLNGIGTDFNVKKHSNRVGAFVEVVLRLRSTSLVKMVTAGVRHERRKASNMKKINLQDIVKIDTVGDDGRMVLLHMKSRVWRLTIPKDALQFALSLQRNMKTYLNRDIEVEKSIPSALIDAVAVRMALLKSYPVLYEFTATKNLEGGSGNQRERGIVITSEHLAELSGEEVIGIQNLSDILGLVVSDKNDNEVILEFRDWRPTQYFLPERDSFVGALAEVMGISKGAQFSVRLEQFFSHTLPDKPLPLYQNECEIYMISRFMSVYNSYKDSGQLGSQRAQSVWFPLLKDYACNMHIGDSLIIDSRPLYAVAEVLRTSLAMKPGLGSSYAVTCCIVLQRLLASRACFDSVKSNPEFAKLLLQAMKSNNSVVAYSAATTLRTSVKFYANEPSTTSSLSFLGSSGPSSAEAANKLVVLSIDNLQILIALLQTHALINQNALQVLGVLEILTMALNLPPASDAEAERQWTNALENSLIRAAEALCATCRTRSSIMFRTNAMLLKTALTKCSLPTANQLQNMLRSRCAVLLYLRHALFSKNERTRELSASLVYLMMEGSAETRAMLKSILPTGFDGVYNRKMEMVRPTETLPDLRASRNVSLRKSIELEERRAGKMVAWLDTLDMLRTDTISTPVLVWNDFKRQELLKFLREEVEVYDRTANATAGRDLEYNSYDTELVFSALSENNEVCKTMIDGIHLEILVDKLNEDEPGLDSHWKLEHPVRLFQAVFHALLVCFTPLYATSNLPEVEPRLAMDALTWIYERHAAELGATIDNLKVVETLVAMLREAMENEHHVFAFKSVFLLLLAVERGGRKSVFKFVKAGGMATIIPLMVVSLAKCCKDVTLFECDAPSVKERRAIERVPVVGADGEVRMARVPSGRTGVPPLPDGSMEARDAIKWQDDSVPEKLQLGMALDLLESILRLSGHDNSAECFPPSAACQDLTRHEILYHLVQMLLRAKAPFFGRILDILVSLFKADKSALPGLYKFGIFDIVLWKLLAGDITKEDKSAIVKFLWQAHLHQEPDGYLHSPLKGLIVVEHIPWNESILRLWLPPGLISKLIQEGPEGFKLKLDNEEDSPELIWNKEMKARLVEKLTADLEPYVKARAADPQALFIYQPRPAIEYPELADTIFVAPLYLHNLLDVERFPNHQVADPPSFHTAVLQEYQRILSSTTGTSVWRQEVPRIVQLAEAQALVLQSHPQIPLSAQAESTVMDIATPALRVCIAQKDGCPAPMTSILAHAASILRSIAKTRAKDTKVSESAISFALSVLSLGIRGKADGSFPDSPAGTSLEPALEGAMGVLELAAATREGRHILRDDVRWRKGFWWALCSSAGAHMAEPEKGPSPVAFSALDCLNHFSGDVELCYRVVKQGLLLPLLLLTVPLEETLPSLRERLSSPSEVDSRPIEQVAAEVLRTLAVTLDQAPEMDPSPRLQFETGILATVIPLAMLTSLKNPDAGAAKFMAMATTDLSQPTAIWNREVRTELRRKVVERVKEHNLQQATGVLTTDDELKWLEEFSYDALKDEMVISGVFVKGYATGHWQHFDLPDGRAFLESLQAYLEANRHILLPPHQRHLENGGVTPDSHTPPVENGGRPVGGKVKLPSTEEDFLIAMAALGECLRYAVEDSKKGMLLQVRYPLLAEVLMKGAHIPAAQMEVAAIAQVLAGHVTAQEELLPSPLLPVMAQKLWEGLVSPDDKAHEVSSSILDAFLELSQEMPATIAATNYFSSSGALLLILALFLDAELPSFGGDVEDLKSPRSHPKAKESGQLVAAQILGHLLLAAMGVHSRAKLVKDLALRRSVGDISALANGHAGGSLFAHVTDMYELSNILDMAQEMTVQPHVLRTLYQFLPLDMLSTLARDPTEACEMVGSKVCTPLLVWEEAVRLRCGRRLVADARSVKESMEREGEGAVGLPAWSLSSQEDPVFLRYVRAVVSRPGDAEEEMEELFSEEAQEGYVKELYMGGFYVDQVLRKPAYEMNAILEDRLLREIRKTVVVAAPSHGARSSEYSFDDRRRLLLALLALFRSRPSLLATSNIDIFFPIYNFIAGGSGEERRGLALPGLLLFHCTVTSSDIAEFVVNEELLNTLSVLLSLKVPQSEEGKAGTDPRLCSLMLLLRLVRYSSKATKTALELDLVGQVASIVFDKGEDNVRKRAAEVLSVMSVDRRCGSEVKQALDRIIPEEAKDFIEWQVPLANINDDVVDDEAMSHFLAHRFPAEWWTATSSEYSSMSEVTEQLPNGRMEFAEQAEKDHRNGVSGAAPNHVEPKDVETKDVTTVD